MEQPTLDYEGREVPRSNREARNERLRRFNRWMFRAIFVHIVASYLAVGFVSGIFYLRGRALTADDARKLIYAPVTILVIVPISVIILFFPSEGYGQPLVFITLPYLAMLWVTAMLLRRRRHIAPDTPGR